MVNNNYSAISASNEENSNNGGKIVLTNPRQSLNTSSNSQSTIKSNLNAHPSSLAAKSSLLLPTNNIGPKAKVNKNSKTSKNQLQKCFSNSSMPRNDQQMMLNTADSNYFNGLNKIENLANNYGLFEASSGTGNLPLSMSNDYQAFTDNAHYNYSNYLNTLNSYNYANYPTSHTSYSIYPHTSNHQLLNNQIEPFSSNQITTTTTTTTTTPTSSSSWFEETSQSKLGQNAYSIINYANSSNQNAYKYNDFFNCANQNAAKYAATVADNFDKSSAASYYLDEYHHHTGLHSNSSLYDYTKYNQNSLISKPILSAAAIASTTIENSNSNFNIKKDQGILLNNHTSSSSLKSSSTTSSSSSSTSPSIPITSQNTIINGNLQDHNNNTSGLFLTNSEFNNTNEGLYKKYENYQNDVKIPSNDRNSLHSFSTSSSCSSASSSSNYCDEATVKSFIK